MHPTPQLTKLQFWIKCITFLFLRFVQISTFSLFRHCKDE